MTRSIYTGPAWASLMLLPWLLATAEAFAAPKQQLLSPGVVFATVNRTDTVQNSLEKLLPSLSAPTISELLALGASTLSG